MRQYVVSRNDIIYSTLRNKKVIVAPCSSQQTKVCLYLFLKPSNTLFSLGCQVKTGDCSIITVLLLKSFCRGVVIGFLELGRYKWCRILADTAQRWRLDDSHQLSTVLLVC